MNEKNSTGGVNIEKHLRFLLLPLLVRGCDNDS